MRASSARRLDADDCPGPSRAGRPEAIRDAGFIEELRAARKRLRALSRRLAELDTERNAAVRELSDEAEQVRIGLDLLERRRQSAQVTESAAKLRRTVERVQRSLKRRG